jgi:hypothetical protein
MHAESVTLSASRTACEWRGRGDFPFLPIITRFLGMYQIVDILNVIVFRY